MAIDVCDGGVGLPEAELERMFHHFMTSKPQGVGIGVAISRSIVHAHDGRIWDSRNADRGLTHHNRLPATNATDSG